MGRKGAPREREVEARRAAGVGLKKGEYHSLDPKQIRARARREAARKGGDITKVQLNPDEKQALMGKPIEEWDLEELARGRTKDANGNFTGAKPKWITQEVHEKAMDRFKDLVRSDMRSVTVKAVRTLSELLDNDELDARDKPVVSAAVKADTAKFLLEHLIGKPKQPIENDISIKLQAVLGAALVMPGQMPDMIPASSHREVEGYVVDDEEDDLMGGGGDG